MITGNKSHHYLEVDEIDHLTLPYTDYGQSLNKEKAVKMILYYSDVYDEVNSTLNNEMITKTYLEALSEKDIYDILVKIRTVLLNAVL